MKTTHILAAAATIALIAGGQALAQGRGGGHGGGRGGGAGVSAGGHARGGAGVGRTRVRSDVGVRTRGEARLRSQGPNRANARARARANANSVLATGRSAVDLSALRTGLVVQDSTGATLGTIARINRSSDGIIRNVLVRDRLGRSRTLPIAPNSISISGNVVTTTLIGPD